MVGYSVTEGQQGGFGWPPLVIKYKGKWVWVEGSRQHGGSVCRVCSEMRNVPHGYRPSGFGEQPRAYGSSCYRSLIEERRPGKPVLQIKGSITWDQFVNEVKKECGEPEIIE